MPEYTSIRVRCSTKEILKKIMAKIEEQEGRRLDYDELLRLLASRFAERKPWLLLKLFENPVDGYRTELAQSMLREEKGLRGLPESLKGIVLDSSILIELLAGSKTVEDLAKTLIKALF